MYEKIAEKIIEKCVEDHFKENFLHCRGNYKFLVDTTSIAWFNRFDIYRVGDESEDKMTYKTNIIDIRCIGFDDLYEKVRSWISSLEWDVKDQRMVSIKSNTIEELAKMHFYVTDLGYTPFGDIEKEHSGSSTAGRRDVHNDHDHIYNNSFWSWADGYKGEFELYKENTQHSYIYKRLYIKE